MEELGNLTNCPHVPAHFLPPVPSITWGSTRRGGAKDKRNLPKEGKKKSDSAHRRAENKLSHVPQNTNDVKDNCASLKIALHSERARVQQPKGPSKEHAKDHTSPSPARKVDLGPGLRIREHLSSLQLCALFSPSQRSKSLACSCHGEAKLKLQPASLHKRHQQQSPATQTAPEESHGVRGARLLHT